MARGKVALPNFPFGSSSALSFDGRIDRLFNNWLKHITTLLPESNLHACFGTDDKEASAGEDFPNLRKHFYLSSSVSWFVVEMFFEMHFNKTLLKCKLVCFWNVFGNAFARVHNRHFDAMGVGRS